MIMPSSRPSTSLPILPALSSCLLLFTITKLLLPFIPQWCPSLIKHFLLLLSLSFYSLHISCFFFSPRTHLLHPPCLLHYLSLFSPHFSVLIFLHRLHISIVKGEEWVQLCNWEKGKERRNTLHHLPVSSSEWPGSSTEWTAGSSLEETWPTMAGGGWL